MQVLKLINLGIILQENGKGKNMNKNKIKVMPIFGTRPEAIKMAPVVKELQKYEEIETVITVTAQHREMLDQVLELFDIVPDYDLDIMLESQSLTDITVNVLSRLEKIYNEENPDIVLVQGDTSTTFVASLAAFYKQIKVGHIEAGLRTNNKYSPFPEEINRKLTGGIADFHFPPTLTSKNNLLNENVDESKIFITGNTVVDALIEVVNKDFKFENSKIQDLIDNDKKYILLTSHRRENLGKPMRNIFNSVKELLENNEGVEVVFPVHLNPKVRRIVDEILGDLDRIHLVEPMDYLPFAKLIENSYLVLTDSGGVQEEAPSLGKPVLVLRDTTERPEAIEAGTVKLVGTDKSKIFNEANKLLNDKKAYGNMAQAVNPYGDGKASERIVKILLNEFLDKNIRFDNF